MTPGFLDGVNCFLEGVKIFFHSRRLWKYSIFPLLLTFASCFLLLWLLFLGGEYLQTFICNGIASLPKWCSFLKTLYNLCHYILFFILTAGFIVFTLPPLFELFHGLFSDALLEEWGKENGILYSPHSFRENLDFLLQNMKFGFCTFLYFLLLLPLSFLIPLIGGIFLWGFLSWRLGLSLLFPVSFLYREKMAVTMQNAKRFPFFVAGFSLAASLSLFIPFLFPLFLPGMTLGGALLYKRIRESLSEK